MLCAVLLTTCAGTVSSDKFTQAIEALKEAEQKIETLNNAVLTLNQTRKHQSALKPFPCNYTYIQCKFPKVSQGYSYYCGSQCSYGSDRHTGNIYCDLCMGTEEA